MNAWQKGEVEGSAFRFLFATGNYTALRVVCQSFRTPATPASDFGTVEGAGDCRRIWPSSSAQAEPAPESGVVADRLRDF